jgi:hypothetical protein
MAIRRWLALQRAARWARFGRVDKVPPLVRPTLTAHRRPRGEMSPA